LIVDHSYFETGSVVFCRNVNLALQVSLMTFYKSLLWMLVVTVSCIPPVSATSEVDLSDYRWKHRLIFIFASSTTDATFLALDKRLAQTALEIEDRDVIVFRIFENSPAWVSDKPLPPGDDEALRRRFGIERGRFTVVLVGKDSGVKLVAHRDADLQSIFNIIDSMPMRQQEMREKRSKLGRSVTAVPRDFQ
jgi:hypothetical protein